MKLIVLKTFAISIIGIILLSFFQNENKAIVMSSEIEIPEEKLIFSHEAGFYENEIELEIISENGYEIYYTTDGSIPDPGNTESTKKYEGLLSLGNRSKMPPSLSRDLRVEIMINSEYRPPKQVRQGNIIRAVSVSPEGVTSRIYSNSYFVGILKDADKNMGVISISGNAHDLFDTDEGIYYKLQNNDYSALINVEYFDKSKERIFSYDANTNVFGGFTRNFAQKSLKLIFDEGTEDEKVDFPIFGDFARDVYGETIDSFSRLRLHTGGNDSKHTTFLDGMMMDLSKDMDLAVSPYTPVITFINGEYWGIYGLREDYKSDFFENRFHVDYDNVIALKIVWGCDNVPDVTSGLPEDIRYYEEMYSFVENYDFSSDTVYEHFSNYYMDIDSFIDFHIANLYVNNIDWPGNNVRLWRTRITEENNPYADTRWRFILHDVDAGLKDTSKDMLEILLKDETSGRGSSDPYNYWATLMFRKLIQNENFVEKFTDKVLYHVNSTYEKQRMLDTIDRYSKSQQPSVAEHKERWNHTQVYPYVNAVMAIRNFVITRDVQFLSSVSKNLKQEKAKKIEFSGFNKLDSTYLYFGDNPMDLTNRNTDFEVYAFKGKTLTVKDTSEKVKGYMVFKDGEFSYEKGFEFAFEIDDTKMKIIPVTFSLKDYLSSAEGIIFVILISLLSFLIYKGYRHKKIETGKKW